MNAASLARFNQQSARVVVDLYEARIVLGGAPMRAAVIVGKRGIDTEDGGYVEDRSAAVQILKTVLRTAPAVGDVLTHEGVSYEINEVEGHRPLSPSWVLRCIESDRAGK